MGDERHSVGDRRGQALIGEAEAKNVGGRGEAAFGRHT
jgi:hypothetical protein